MNWKTRLKAKTALERVNAMIFDYDQTLVDGNIELPLLKILVELGVKKIRVWSNGCGWFQDGILKKYGIVAEHVNAPNPASIPTFWDDFDMCVEEASKVGQAHNVSALKYIHLLDDDSVLVDDLSNIWGSISTSARNLSPEKALEILGDL